MPTTTKERTKTDVYDLITQQFIDALENELIPWRRTWTRGLPKNLVSKKPYRGINLFLLSLVSTDKYYVTFKQAHQLGGCIKQGSKSIPIVYWRMREVEEDNEKTGEIERKSIPVLKYYRVFGISQTEGLEQHIPKESENPVITDCQDIVASNNPIIHSGSNPSYSPALDLIRIPNLNDFDTSEDYYSTLFHEMGHWTGNKIRLNREELIQTAVFGSSDYSKEELTAELTASFLCNATGIRNTKVIEDEIAYIQSWIGALKRDKKFIISASSKARKAADFILKNVEKFSSPPDVNFSLKPDPVVSNEQKATKGSKFWLRTYVEKMPDILSWQIINACPDFNAFDYSNIEWISPIPKTHYYEYSHYFLEAIGLLEYQPELDKFWPTKKPVWDGLSVIRVSRECYFLVEAKSYVRETLTEIRAIDRNSIAKINNSLSKVKEYMGVDQQRDWAKPYYQFCNRLALLFFLNVVIRKSSYLALVNFVDDISVGQPTSEEQWKKHYRKVFFDLGISQKSKLAEKIISVYPTARI